MDEGIALVLICLMGGAIFLIGYKVGEAQTESDFKKAGCQYEIVVKPK